MRKRALATALVAAMLAPACSYGAGEQQRTLTVFAASSLTAVFGALEREFELRHPDVDVLPTYEGSAQLAAQLSEGAPGDVFASADEANMDKISELVRNPEVFATNTLMIAVAKGNPHRIRGLADLARPELRVITCTPEAPCGAAARRVQQAAGVTLAPVSEEPNVRSVVMKVENGEADAGIVYRTDIRGRELTGVPIAEAGQAVNRYPIASLADAPEPELAREFVELVLGDYGQGRLRAMGFGAP